jgi:SAM-dependent methyltransferase
MEEKVVRTHDEFYLKENRMREPKEYFKFIMNHSKEYFDSIDNISVLDIGCATGDFLYYFNTLYKNQKLYGLDVMEKLLVKAREDFPIPHYSVGNIQTGENLPEEKFDAVFLLGVTGIFDDLNPIVENISKLLKPTGRAYIFGGYNPEDLDVMIKSRSSCTDGPWETGWNLHSLKTLSSIFTKNSLKHSYHEFKIGIDLPKHDDDPLRSWTIKLENGNREVVNGLQLLHNFYLIELIK